MQCNFLPMVNSVYSSRSVNNQAVGTPSFCGRAQEKLIKKIMSSNNPKEWKYTFEDIKGIYEHLGFDVMMKRGSHAIVRINGTNLPLVIPHGDKYVSPMDVKRLKCLLLGDIDKALRM